MPTYEYECSKCGKSFETFQSMMEPPLTDCPDEQCGGRGTVRRLISSGAGLIFKGSGFYITDYKKSGESGTTGEGDKTASGKSDSAKPETAKTEAAAPAAPASSGGKTESSSGSN